MLYEKFGLTKFSPDKAVEFADMFANILLSGKEFLTPEFTNLLKKHGIKNPGETVKRDAEKLKDALIDESGRYVLIPGCNSDNEEKENVRSDFLVASEKDEKFNLDNSRRIGLTLVCGLFMFDAGIDCLTKKIIYENRGNGKTWDLPFEPKEHSPGLSVDDWVKLLGDWKIFDFTALKTIKEVYDPGGTIKPGEFEKNFGKEKISATARKIFAKTVCKLSLNQDGSINWSAIFFQNTDKDVWQLRDELVKAWEQFEYTEVVRKFC